MPNSRSGFTLIEILCAMGAFILVFLTGSGGLMRLMMTQTTNQQRTVAASAALLLADWHATKSIADASPGSLPFEADIAPSLVTLAGTVGALNQIKWKGTAPNSSENVYTFNTSATDPGVTSSYGLADLAAYQQVIVVVSAVKKETGTDMQFHVVSLWYGEKASVVANTSDRLEFLASYLMTDKYTP